METVTETKNQPSQFEQELAKLNSLISGDDSLFDTNKVSNDLVGNIVNELTKERKDKARQEFKTKLSSLLDKKLTFDKFKNEEEKKFKKAIEDKEKEFVKDLKEIFNMVENINELHKSYTESLNKAK
jgi:hypothetical protein